MSAKKKKKLAPLVSRRPLTQEEAAAPRKASEAFGDIEMRIDHEELLRKNPIARLGYDPSKVDVIQKAVDNAYYYPSKDRIEVFSAPRSKDYKTKIKTGPDTEEIINAKDLHTLAPNVYVHEFTHRGFKQIRDFYDKDPESFKKKYGEDAVDVLKRYEEEGIVELTDALDEPYLVGGHKRDNRMFLTTSSEKSVENFQKGDTYHPSFKGLRNLFNAAEDILRERGEPEPAEHNPPNFFQRTLRRIGLAEGGSVKDNPIWKHHQMNVDNKTYVKNDDGSISTVFTTILGDGEREYLIPKVWDGEILSDEDAWERAMSSGIEWPSAVSGEEGVRQLEQLDEELHKDMRGYADGGEVMTMERQMSLFEEGGLADDGMTKEPVTGNEIPPGSMAKEVRDDVPAQLSEGEYVVPADVVRYYGVKFFEDLRQEAKGGMMEMEQEGRIGGTAVDNNGIPVEDDNLTPEEERMLMEALAADRPQAMAKGGVVKGYAEGGQVFQPSFTGQVSPYGMTNAYGGSGFEARQYVNTSTGQIRTFQFLNGMPISMIPEGFVPATQEAIAAAGQAKDQTTTETTGTGQATGQVEPEGRGFDPQKDLYGQTDSAFDKTTSEGSMAAADKGLSKANFSDPLGTAKSALEGKGTVGKIAGTVLGGVLAGPIGAKIGGALGQNAQVMGGITEAAVNSEIASILGYDTTSVDSAIEGKIAGMGILNGTATTNAVQNARAAAREAVFSVDSPFALTEDKFQTKEAFDKAMEYGAPTGMSYDPTMTSEIDIGGGKTATVEGGYSREGSAAPETSSRPQAPTGNVAATRAANDAKAASGGGGGIDYDGYAAKADAMTPAEVAADMSGEGPGGGGGDTVICTALHNLGRLDSKIYALDKEYGLAIEKTNPDLLYGYRKLATPLADYIQENTFGARVAREVVTPFAKAWAREMAHTLKPEEYKGNILGKAIMLAGYPVCAFVGRNLKGVKYAV